MSLGLLGLKVGMTQVYDEQNKIASVTVLQIGPCPVLQVRNKERDGYDALQLGFLDKKREKATRAERGHVSDALESKRRRARTSAGVALPPKANCEPQKHVREFRLDKPSDAVVGKVLTAWEVFGDSFQLTGRTLHDLGEDGVPEEALLKLKDVKGVIFPTEKEFLDEMGKAMSAGELEKFKDKLRGRGKGVKAVDLIGTSKGRGTAGVMKQHNFAGLPASHGVKKHHRSPGSVGSHASNRGSGRPKRGKRMAGRWGAERVTMRNLRIVKIDADNHLVLVEGSVPGPNGGLVMIRPTNKKK